MDTNLMWKRHGRAGDADYVAKMYLVDGAASDFNAGGKLDPAQQLGLINALRAQSTLLGPYLPNGIAPSPGGGIAPPGTNPSLQFPNASPFPGAPAPVAAGGPGITAIASSSGRTGGKIESMLASGYVITGATEATRAAGPSRNILKPGVLQWEYKKYHAFAEWSKETTWQTILEDRFDEFLMSRLFPIMAHNLEEAALHGDEDLAGDDPRTQLLRVNDGWLKQMRRLSPELDYEGAFIDEQLFVDMLVKMPDIFQMRRKYWFCNEAIGRDWMRLMRAQAAATAEASLAIRGFRPAPFDIQFWHVPLLARDEPVTTIAVATHARHVGVGQDRFSFPTDAYRFTINVDGQGAVTVEFPHIQAASLQDRATSVYRACKIINDALVTEYADRDYNNVARVNQRGQIELVSPTAGAGSSIILAAPASSCLAVLGFTAGNYVGQAAAAAGTNTANIGTSMFLTVPENLQWRFSTAPSGSGEAGFSQYVKYRQENDMLRYDSWFHHDFTLDTPEAAVIAHGIRTAGVGETPVP